MGKKGLPRRIRGNPPPKGGRGWGAERGSHPHREGTTRAQKPFGVTFLNPGGGENGVPKVMARGFRLGERGGKGVLARD